MGVTAISAFTVKSIDKLESIHHGAVKLAGAGDRPYERLEDFRLEVQE